MTAITTTTAPAPAAAGRLAYLPVSFFSTVMGTAGLGIATLHLEASFGMQPIASLVMLGTAATMFVVIACFYIAKLIRHRSAVVGEWHHPVRLSFFPTISISLLLLAVLSLRVDKTAAEILWINGAALHLIFSLAVLSAWIGHRTFETPHLNPGWFIPAVGNIVVPLAGIPLGYVEISWFFFATGVLFWMVLMTLIFNRLIFHSPLPDHLVPTLMILVAPPAVGFLSYLKLNGGTVDGVARMFLYAGLALFLLVASQAVRMAKIKFALSWWAYSFPIAALTTAFAVFSAAIGGWAPFGLFVALYGLLALVIAILLFATLRAIVAGAICRPEH